MDFVCAPTFLQIALRIAMATMHFHILAQTATFWGNFFCIKGGPKNKWHQLKIVLGVQGRSN